MNFKLFVILLSFWVTGNTLGYFCERMPYWLYLVLCFLGGCAMAIVARKHG